MWNGTVGGGSINSYGLFVAFSRSPQWCWLSFMRQEVAPLTLLKALAHCALMKIVWQERQGMLSRSYWRPRKKNYWSLRFEPWTKLGSKSALLRKPYFLDHSQIPTRECVFFCPAKQSANQDHIVSRIRRTCLTPVRPPLHKQYSVIKEE